MTEIFYIIFIIGVAYLASIYDDAKIKETENDNT